MAVKGEPRSRTVFSAVTQQAVHDFMVSEFGVRDAGASWMLHQANAHQGQTFEFESIDLVFCVCKSLPSELSDSELVFWTVTVTLYEPTFSHDDSHAP